MRIGFFLESEIADLQKLPVIYLDALDEARHTTKENRTKWTTKAGNFSTNRKCEITFTLPALHKH